MYRYDYFLRIDMRVCVCAVRLYIDSESIYIYIHMPVWVRMTSMNAHSVFTHGSILPHMLTTQHGIQHNFPTTMNDIKWQKWVWVSLNAMNQRSKIWCYARWVGLIFERIQCINSPSLEHEVFNNTTIQAVHSQAFCPMLSWNLGIFNRNIAHISVPALVYRKIIRKPPNLKIKNIYK